MATWSYFQVKVIHYTRDPAREGGQSQGTPRCNDGRIRTPLSQPGERLGLEVRDGHGNCASSV